MKLILYLFKRCRREILAVAALGVAGGLSSAALIAVVGRVVRNASTPTRYIVAAFVAVAVVKIASALASSFLLVRLSQNSVLRLCDELCVRIIEAPFRQIEETGAPRLLALLTDDIATLTAAIQAIPALTVNLAILLGCSAYLVWLSWKGALILGAFAAVGATGYKFLLARAHRAIRRARDARDGLFRHFRSLTDGIKELKLNRPRREAFLRDEVGASIELVRLEGLIAANQYVIADGWSQIMFYGLMAVMLFALPGRIHVTQDALMAYVFVALYAAAPIWSIIAVTPIFDRGRDALERLQAIGLSMTSEGDGAPVKIVTEHPRVEFRGVEFSYTDRSGNRGFTLGPLDLSLEPGELVFVIGGNGSGKSTFVKLLTGLYTPGTGELRIDGRVLTDADQENYRQLFSVVYSDFYLFDRLLGITDQAIQSIGHQYLETLQLSHKVKIEGNRLSTTDLSQGQRRRLALLAAYLEDRPIFVLDEWAADQDPTYREIFYTRLLPDLKRRGKTIVVVTHDDRYFHMGDRLLKLDYGGLVDQWKNTSPYAASSERS